MLDSQLVLRSRSVEPIGLKSIFGVQRDISFRVGVNSIYKVNEIKDYLKCISKC